jgi:hypothetical protein
MLHSKAGKNLQFSVVQGHWNVHNQLAVGVPQHLPQAFLQIEFLRGKVEARRLRLPGIDFLFEGNRLHDASPIMTTIL